MAHKASPAELRSLLDSMLSDFKAAIEKDYITEFSYNLELDGGSMTVSWKYPGRKLDIPSERLSRPLPPIDDHLFDNPLIDSAEALKRLGLGNLVPSQPIDMKGYFDVGDYQLEREGTMPEGFDAICMSEACVQPYLGQPGKCTRARHPMGMRCLDHEECKHFVDTQS